MIIFLKKFFKKNNEKVNKWVFLNYIKLAIFNTLLVLLVLLRSAGYFFPFFELTINLIILLALIFTIILFKSGSRFMFFITLIFWFIAAFFRTINIDVWAERTTIYAFQAFIVGMVLFIYELITQKS